MKNWKPGKHGLALATVLALGASPAFTQAQEADTANDEEVIELSPFVVETTKDVGYLATNSISGTRLNMEIKDVPMNLEVITGKFIKDTGATNLRDALRYSPGLVLQSQADAFDNSKSGDFTIGYAGTGGGGANNTEGATRTAGDSTTKMRGTENSYILQDGFHRVYSADTVNIERVEVLRGPSALLYGSGNAGGVINFISKKPVFEKQMYHFGTTVGRYGLYRGEMDVNLPLASEGSMLGKYKPAFRLTAAYEENEDYTDYYTQEHWQVNGAFSFKPLEHTTITLGAEFGDKKETGNGFQNIRASDGEAGTNAAWVTDLRVWDESTNTVNSQPNPDLDYRTWRWSGDDTYTKGPFRNFTFDLEQSVGDNLFFKLGYSHSKAEFDTRQIITNLFSQAGNALVGSYTSIWTGETYTDRAGTRDATTGIYSGGLYSPYVEGGTFGTYTSAPTTRYDAVLGYYWQDTTQEVTRDQVRAEVVYKLDTGNWGNHTFIGGFSYEKENTVSDLYCPPSTWTETYYDDQGRVVADIGASHQVSDVDRYSFKSLSDFTAFQYGVQGDGIADNPKVHWQNVEENNWNQAYYAVYQGQFFQDKLTFVGGLRWDRNDFNKVRSYPYANSLIGGEDPYGTSVTYGRVDEVYDTNGSPNTSTSPQIGINYALTDQISLFAVYSEGTKPHYYALDGNGDMLDPEKTKSKEIGLKFDFFEGKLSGTISAYELERENVPYFVWWAPNPNGDLYNGFIDSQPVAMLWDYCTPDAFYDMFAYSGLDPATCLATIKSQWPECWWPSIDEVYNYVVTNNITSANAYDSHGTWSWGDFGTFSASLSDWSLFSEASANSHSPVEGTDVYFPLVRLTDDNVAALIRSKLYSTTWTGNLYSNNNGEHYLYRDASTGDSVLGVNNTRGANGAFVAMSDEAKGWDMNVTWTPIPELQVMMGFSHLNRTVTSKRYVFVDAEYSPGAKWLDSGYAYGTLSEATAIETYADINDASTYMLDSDGNLITMIPLYGKSMDDSPENTVTLWARYELKHAFGSTPFLKNLAIGLGGQWEDQRMWFTGFTSSGNVCTYTDLAGNEVLIEKWTDERVTINGMIEYTTRLQDKYDLRVALNVDNISDDKSVYGNIYASGMSWKLSASIDF
ncbi:MAG: TonB-dependent receptor [Opitutales bacterium]|nr:TonB-dependent receptor [Opitutales bacterium]